MKMPECKLSLDEFVQRIVEAGLLDLEQLAAFTTAHPGNDARSFARQLVEDKKLTRFQTIVLLEDRGISLVLDRYIILDEIGAGGMGAVFKALHQQMDRVVALKILPKEAVDSPDKVKRFQREVKAVAKLDHPNIVTAFDAHESKGIHYLVMAYVEGHDLAKIVSKQGPFSVAKAVDYVVQTAYGLEHAHKMGIIHRDIKPANLLLNQKNKVKILDMGLARIENAEILYEKTVSQDLTQYGMLMGTVAYLAPEQAIDTHHADARSDIYSLGCTLFYLLTGKALYLEDSMMKTILAHREGVIPSLCDERAGLPKELDAVFQKMVAKQPPDRYQSMTEVILALEALEIEEGDEEVHPLVAGLQAMHETATFIDTSRDMIEAKPSLRSPKPYWPLITACLLGFAGLFWAATVLLTVETPAGKIIIEFDQPELAGAVVSIDGEQKITIQTGKGLEPIDVFADSERHLLEVVKGGFETFTKEFTVKAGGNQTIKIRLEPLTPRLVVARPTITSAYNWPKDQPEPAIAPFNAEEAKQYQEAWAKHLGVEVETSNSIGMKFRVIPPCEFMMGSTTEEIRSLIESSKGFDWYKPHIQLEAPQHHVTLSQPFALGIHEVTREQFRKFVEDSGYKTVVEKSSKGGWGFERDSWIQSPRFYWSAEELYKGKVSEQHPVSNITQTDAMAFCRWLSEKEGVNYRLPTEAEWEFASRSGTTSRYFYGDQPTSSGKYVWNVLGKKMATPSEVGMTQPNPFGLFDMLGNLSELCLSDFRNYPPHAVINPTGLKNPPNQVLRGGNFTDLPLHCRSAFRQLVTWDLSNHRYGFRIMRTFETPKTSAAP